MTTRVALVTGGIGGIGTSICRQLAQAGHRVATNYRDRAKAALERAKSHSSQAIQIDPALLEQFGRSMRENFTSGSIPFRKAYLQSLIDVVEVDDAQIRIKG